MDQPGKQVIKMPFVKEGENKELLGIILGRKRGVYELEVTAEHQTGRTFGRVVIAGIAEKGAQVAVKGTIKIDKQAQGVDDFLEMRMLVLDEQSSAIAQPQLEIEANEVKASHAATVGRLDEEGVFYLRSRGMKEEDARRMMVKGFLNRVVEQITEDKERERLGAAINQEGGKDND